MGVGELAVREGEPLQDVGPDKHTGRRDRLGQGLQRDVDADDEGLGEQGAHFEGPDAGAHVEELVGLGDRGEDVTAQEATQGGEGGRDTSRPPPPMSRNPMGNAIHRARTDWERPAVEGTRRGAIHRARRRG